MQRMLGTAVGGEVGVELGEGRGRIGDSRRLCQRCKNTVQWADLDTKSMSCLQSFPHNTPEAFQWYILFRIRGISLSPRKGCVEPASDQAIKHRTRSSLASRIPEQIAKLVFVYRQSRFLQFLPPHRYIMPLQGNHT